MNGLIGRTLGPYRIVDQIGEGGMATIFRAYQPGLDRYVALKVLPPLHAQQPGFSERFRREARAIANLHHPNILPVYEFGQEDEYSYLVMRYVEEARTLKTVMREGVDLDTAVDLIGQIAGALDHAHQRGVIHRDIKPGNVLMDGKWALLTDFGLAKMTEASIQLTGSGVGVGTPAYMSPEQGQGGQVDHRTDIYSLGVILFEMLTGQIPHNAETPFAIVLKRVTEPLPIPRTLNPNIPEAVERVILKALAREPSERFSSAGEMAEALKKAASAVAPTVTALEMPEIVPEAEPVSEQRDERPAEPVVEAPTVSAEPVERAVPVPEPRVVVERAEVGVDSAVVKTLAATPQTIERRPGRTFPWKWVVGIGVLVVVAIVVVVGSLNGWWARDTEPEVAVAPTATPIPIAAVDTATPTTASSEPGLGSETLLTVRLRLHLVSNSDWAYVDLGIEGEVAESQTVETSGDPNQAQMDGERLSLDQDIAQAEEGNTISVVEDLVLSDVVPGKKMWLSVRKGCIGTVTLEVYNVEVEPPALVDRAYLPECNPEMLLLYPEYLTTASPRPSPTPLPSMHPGYAHLERGISLFNEGQHEQAYAELDQALGLGLVNSEVYTWRGMACREWRFYEGGCSYDQAVADLTAALEGDPENVRIYVERAWTYSLWGDYSRSVADYDRAIELEPDNSDHYFDRASAHRSRGYWDAAIEDIDQAIRMNPERADYWRERGWTNFDRRALDEAIPDFDRAIEIDSQECLAYWGRALVYREQEQYHATLDDLNSAIEICPTIGQLYVDRGWLYYFDIGDSDQALRDLSTGIEIVPEETNLYYQRGLLYDYLGMEAEARADFEQYLELTGNDPNADWYNQVQRWLADHPE